MTILDRILVRKREEVADAKRFVDAREIPWRIFSRLKVSRCPLLFVTCSSAASMYSKVVNRLPQSKHSRRRRIDSPS